MLVVVEWGGKIVMKNEGYDHEQKLLLNMIISGVVLMNNALTGFSADLVPVSISRFS